jgi:hypothetical protein
VGGFLMLTNIVSFFCAIFLILALMACTAGALRDWRKS